jgi:rare lipoprotein A
MAIPGPCRQALRFAVVLLGGASLVACAGITPRYPSQARGPQTAPPAQGEYKVGKPYQVGGVWYVPREQPNYDQTGVASWYGEQFHMKATANGERFDMAAVSAAHTTLPLPSLVEVTNLDNGRRLVVRVNDRGPFVGDRIIDLSREAARQLGFERQGLARVRVKYVGAGPLLGPDGGLRYANAKPYPTRLPAAPAATAAAAVASSADPVMEMAAAAPRAAPRAAAITSEALPPITGSAISSAPIPPAPSAVPAITAAAAPVDVSAIPIKSALRIQAGAFTSEVNAQRAVSQLSEAGRATIEPLDREGLTLYRVVLPAPEDEAAAYALRDRVAEIGFADARVVRTF